MDDYGAQGGGELKSILKRRERATRLTKMGPKNLGLFDKVDPKI